MRNTKVSNSYVAEVLAKLSNNPTAQDIDYFIEAHARIGYLVGIARGRSELADATVKFRRATEYANARATGAAKSAVDAEQIAIIAAYSDDQISIRSRESYTKLSNLLSSIEQAINGIKFLGRATDVNLPGMKR